MKLWIALGALNAFISVAAGAFGAHALKTRLDEYSLGIFETGARYQMYHALALVLVGLFAAARPEASVGAAGWAFVAGIALFTGSLYALAFTGIKVLGAVTPFGGLGFLVGWALFAWAALKA